MKNRDLIDILDEMIETIEQCKDKLSGEIMKHLDELNEEAQSEFDIDYRKCDACGEYVPEDYIEERYDENICHDCLVNGYGD